MLGLYADINVIDQICILNVLLFDKNCYSLLFPACQLACYSRCRPGRYHCYRAAVRDYRCICLGRRRRDEPWANEKPKNDLTEEN